MTEPEAIYHDERLARAYDELNPWGPSDDFYRALAAESGGPVLDIGCGTGTFACRIAAEDGLDVTGLDPAPAMLRVARAKPEATKVTWIEGNGCSADIGKRFAFIVMTGHAFQALPNDNAMADLLRNAARHLAVDGRFAFETRNPAARAWQQWTPDKTRERLEESRCGLIENWHDAVAEPPATDGTITVHLTTWFRFADSPEPISGDSTLRFIGQDRLAEMIERAGLVVERWRGDFDGRVYGDESPEILPICRLA